MEIQRLTQRDLARFRAVRLRSLRDAPAAFGTTAEEAAAWPREVWARLFSGLLAFVAVESGQDVGLVRGAPDREVAKAARLGSLWVAPEARGRGLGAQLVGAVVDWARLNRADSIELWVMTTNERARRLYERCGFEVKDGHRAAPDDPCRNEVRMRMEIEH